MVNQKAFTLIEVLISITLLTVIVLFLYQSLDITQKSNKFFYDKLELKTDDIYLKKIIFKDIIQSENKLSIISEDGEKKSIFSLKSSNTYHDTFYENITYLVSKENELLRIESKEKFNKEKLNDDFFYKAYVDVVAVNVFKFKVIKKAKDQYAVYLEFKNDSEYNNDDDSKNTRDMIIVIKSMKE